MALTKTGTVSAVTACQQ